MGKTESSKTVEQFALNLFLANVRSAKGKSIELTALTTDYNIICLTETHVDSTIDNRNLIETPGLDFFRQDRNLHGGGVLIATKRCLQARRLAVDAPGEEIVMVKISKLIVC